MRINLELLKKVSSWVWPAITTTALGSGIYFADGKLSTGEIVIILGVFLTNLGHHITEQK